MRKQILKAKIFSRAELLNNQRKKENKNKLVLNISYHPSLAQLKVIMAKMHLHLTPDNEHNKVFRDVPIVGFQKYLKLKTKVGAALVKDLDVKFANILHPL